MHVNVTSEQRRLLGAGEQVCGLPTRASSGRTGWVNTLPVLLSSLTFSSQVFVSCKHQGPNKEKKPPFFLYINTSVRDLPVFAVSNYWFVCGGVKIGNLVDE